MNFLHLTVSEIQPGKNISRRPPAHPDTMGENNTPTALKGCGVKTVTESGNSMKNRVNLCLKNNKYLRKPVLIKRKQNVTRSVSFGWQIGFQLA